MRVLKSILAVALLLLGLLLSAAHAFPGRHFGGGSAAGGSYTGPCDTLSGGCAEAFSVAHALTVSYSGPLFQLIRSSDGTTLNVGQTSQHTANLSGVPAFCYTTVNTPVYCYYNKIYAQIHTDGTNDLPVYGTQSCSGCGSSEYPGPFNCASTIYTSVPACAAVFWIDPATGLPLVPTEWPAEYINDANMEGITAYPNAGPIAILVAGHDEQGDYGGANGLSHQALQSGGYGEGTMFGVTNQREAIGYNDYQLCPSAPASGCLTVENELDFGAPAAAWNQGAYTPAGRVVSIIEFSGAQALFTGSISTTALTIDPTPQGCQSGYPCIGSPPSDLVGTVASGQTLQTYGNATHPISATTTITGGSGLSWTVSPSQSVSDGPMVTAGGSLTNVISGYINGSLVFSNSPPNEQAAVASPPPGSTWMGPQYPHWHIGGGDGTHATRLDQDWLVMNRTLTSGEVTAVNSNLSAFASAQTPNACRSTGDPGYFYNGPVVGEGLGFPVSQTLAAWGLRQMSASWTGPIVDLRENNSPNTINTYGPASSGCGLDPAAATFCSAGGGCTVSKLYDQDWFAPATGTIGSPVQGIQNTHQGTIDMTAASTAAEPSVTFSGLNSQPVMHFSGAQALCTASMPVDPASGFADGFSVVNDMTVGASLSVVARRTSGGSLAEIFSTDSDAVYIGANAANTMQVLGSGTTNTETASDGHWHQLYAEQGSPSQATFSFKPYVDGVAGSSNAYSTNIVFGAKTCLGGSSTGTNLLTGDIAEATITGGGTAGSSLTQFASPNATLFSLEEAAWGGLPN